jgi:DNA-binding ferritin-like protein (Dps family)
MLRLFMYYMLRNEIQKRINGYETGLKKNNILNQILDMLEINSNLQFFG